MTQRDYDPGYPYGLHAWWPPRIVFSPMTTHTPPRGAESRPVGATWEERGRDIARRRADLGIKTASSLADLSGIDRKTVARAEQGTASENTYLRLESWLSRRESGDHSGEGAVVTAAQDEEPIEPDHIRVNIIGPHAEWKVCVEGPREGADEMTNMAAELARRLRAGDPPP